MVDIHITLLSVGFAAIITIWLAARCGVIRAKAKVSHGDGGDPALIKRMRAQANFTEYTPFALLLILALELAGQGGKALAICALAFLLGRILHAIGMESDGESKFRMFGMLLTLPLLLAGAIAALLTAFQVI